MELERSKILFSEYLEPSLDNINLNVTETKTLNVEDGLFHIEDSEIFSDH